MVLIDTDSTDPLQFLIIACIWYSVYDNTWWWLGFKPKHVVIHVFNKARWNIVANEGLLYSFLVCLLATV
jgi:hypothetical protein